MLTRVLHAVESIRQGVAARRRFDAAAYLALYPDVARAGMNPWKHYRLFGQNEGRQCPQRRLRIRWRVEAAIKASGLFDAAFYQVRYPDVAASGLSPARHYLERGFREGKDPGPHFSTNWYLAQNPDAAGMNPLLHYLELGHLEGRPTAPPPGVIEAAQALMAGVRDLDPDLFASPRYQSMLALPVLDGRRAAPRVKVAVAQAISALGQAYSHLVVVPWLTFGGADLFALHVVRAAIARHGADSVVVIVADHDRIEALSWVPPGVAVFNLARLLTGLTLEERLDVLERLFQTLHPAHVLNVNSGLLWEACARRGGVLRHYVTLYACLFCRDFERDGRPAGYADTHFRASFGWLKGVYCDTDHFIGELAERYGLSVDDRTRMVALHAPARVEHGLRAATAPRVPGSGLRILWAGRLCRQKNVKLLAQIIAAAPPTWHFDIWGGGEAEEVAQLEAAIAAGAKARLCGPFSEYLDLPLAQYDACLYTSLWDGMPNAILEAAAVGFPLVAAAVGGIGELITPQTGWLVPEIDSAEPFIAALAQIDTNPAEAEQRRRALMAALALRHSADAFVQDLSQPGQFLGTPT